MTDPTASSSWYVRSGRLESGRYEVTAYVGAEHPDGAVVDADALALALAPALATTPWLWRAEASADALIRVVLADNATPGAPQLWFVNVDEPRATPAATNLVAFATGTFAPGTIVDKYQFATSGVSNDDQAGAVRWYPATGVVHQVFVAEQWRRMQVGTALLYTASAFHQSSGWPGHLRADGRRTELGERLAHSLKQRARVTPLTERMPAMDPALPQESAGE